MRDYPAAFRKAISDAPQVDLVARHLLLHPDEIASAPPKEQEALWKYVHEQGWKSLYHHDRGMYFRLKRAAKKLNDRMEPRLEAAHARGRAVQAKLEEAEGGSISTSEAAARLGISRATLLRWYGVGKVIGWKKAKNKVRFPVWQFRGSQLLPGLAEVLGIANAGWQLLDEYGRMLFLLSNLRSLNGRRPVDLLREGDAEGAMKAILDNLCS
jgi:hypothetical protein